MEFTCKGCGQIFTHWPSKRPKFCSRECLREHGLIHGHSTRGLSPTYQSWRMMMERCFNLKNNEYPNYGGRGITVCVQWRSFANFLSEMGLRPTGMTIDRKDNNGNYELSNCRWATKIQQGNNRRNNHLLIIDGVSHTVSEWARLNGLNPKTVFNRLVDGKSPREAIGRLKRRDPQRKTHV